MLNTKVITDSIFDKYMDVILERKFKGDCPINFSICVWPKRFTLISSKKNKRQLYFNNCGLPTKDSSVHAGNKFMQVKGKWIFNEIN